MSSRSIVRTTIRERDVSKGIIACRLYTIKREIEKKRYTQIKRRREKYIEKEIDRILSNNAANAYRLKIS